MSNDIDQALKDALLALETIPANPVAIPEYIFNMAHGSSKKLVPYVALRQDNLANIDAILMHKDLLHRLGNDLVSCIYFLWHPCFANEVYVVFAKSSLKRSSPQQESGLAEHLGPIESFVAARPLTCKRPPKTGRVAVVSAFGVGNIGDDLVSLASARMLEDIGFSEVTLTGPNPSYDVLCDADVIALGGGGLFYDSDLENLANYIYPLQEARRQRKPFLALGVGVQALHSELGKSIYRQNLAFADLLAIRDQVDADQLLEIDPSLSNIFVGNDMAFYLADELRASASSVEKPRKLALFSMSITLKEAFSARGLNLNSVAQKTISYLKSIGFDVLLALHSHDDIAFYQELSRSQSVRIVSLERLGIFGSAKLYNYADVVVTSRFHALILACIFEKPVVSVYGAGRGGRLWKSGRLLHGSLPTWKDQSQSISEFRLETFFCKIAGCRPGSREDVKRCVAATVAIKDQVRRVLEAKNLANGRLSV